jgi:hypothetical protein
MMTCMDRLLIEVSVRTYGERERERERERKGERGMHDRLKKLMMGSTCVNSCGIRVGRRISVRE